MKLGVPVVTIKLTESELVLLNQMVGHHIADWEEKEKVMQAKYKLQKDLLSIEEWLKDEKQKAINDKTDPKKEYINKITGKESLKEQIQKKSS